MSGVIATNPKYQFLAADGTPLVGGTLTTYLAGTTTPAATYQDEALSTANTNPITLDARGECTLWLDSTKNYKFVLANSVGVTQWTVDDISPSGTWLKQALAAANGASLIGYTTPDSATTTLDQLAASGIDKGAHMVGWVQSGAESLSPPLDVRRTKDVQAKLRETVSVRDFGAVGDGVTDDTAAVVAANAASLTLTFPADGLYNLTNWVPLADTKILAHGATIQRGSTATYDSTGSSAAIVLANNGVEIFGGKITDDSGLAQATFSGAVLVDGGDNCALRNVELTGVWSGVFGNLAQNGSNVANNFTLDGCWLHDNQHNTYLADIDGLIVTGGVFEKANRDGLKTYRNTQNITITGNIFRDNGDNTVGQSQNGLDLFIAGNKCIISNNLIYNNIYDKGIDIKRNTIGAGEALQNEKFIISNNKIHGNGGIGIEFEVAGGVGYIDNVSVIGNHIFDNAGRGIFASFLRNSDISHNNIYNNVTDGIRLDDVDDVRVLGNDITNNDGNGINVVSGNGVLVSQNIVTGTADQINGILFAAAVTGSRCADNLSTGHTNNYQAQGSALGVKGKTIDAEFTNTTASQFIGFSERGSTSGIEIMLDNTATMDVTVSKRNETTGANVGNITSNLAESFPTPYVAVNQTITGSNSLRNLAGNNAILLTLANITSGFTVGWIRLHYID